VAQDRVTESELILVGTELSRDGYPVALLAREESSAGRSGRRLTYAGGAGPSWWLGVAAEYSAITSEEVLAPQWYKDDAGNSSRDFFHHIDQPSVTAWGKQLNRLEQDDYEGEEDAQNGKISGIGQRKQASDERKCADAFKESRQAAHRASADWAKRCRNHKE
jgi:hypothetical protein